jgi:hypothetical protein
MSARLVSLFLRTRVLRPTWHFVRAEDIGWLLDVTGPRVQREYLRLKARLTLP